MRAQVVIPVLVSILILGTLGLSQEAFATTFTVSNEAECLAFPGTTAVGIVSGVEGCILSSDFTLNTGDVLEIHTIQFAIASTFTNFGTIDAFGGDSFGTGRIILFDSGHLINECGGVINAHGSSGIQSGEIGLGLGTPTLTNFDTINLIGESGILSGSLLFGTAGPTVNNHGIINEIPGTGNFSGQILNDVGGTFNDNLPNPCVPRALNDLISDIEELDLSKPSEKSLTQKLNNAIKFLTDKNEKNDLNSCNKLDDFVNQVNAQEGKGLTPSQADLLRDSVDSIKTSIGCP